MTRPGHTSRSCGRGDRWFTTALVLAAVVVSAFMGCQDSRFLTGRYCSSEKIQLPGAAAPWVESKYVSLEIGHYGPDVGGMVGFHDDEKCGQEFKAEDMCPCSPIEAGVFDNGKLSFLFEFQYLKTQGCTESGPSCVMDGNDLAAGRNCEWGKETIHVLLAPMDKENDLAIEEFGTESGESLHALNLVFNRESTSATDLEKEDKYRNQCAGLFSKGGQ
ncbi:MAG: hypothetical protein GXP54_12110 [Deltaproteobacteria bacterium]|nr:hypothetical protein [Deltaproteobacteria bacterium]